MEMIDVLQKLKEIAESRPELVKDAVDNVTRTNPKVDESGMKRAMEDDAESMSKDEFVKKYGSAMASFWEAYNGAEEAVEGKIPAGLKAYQDKKAGKEEKKEEVKESIQISADTPQEASMMMQLLKLAGVQPVDQAMISQGEPEADAGHGCGPSCAEHGCNCEHGQQDDEMGSGEMAKLRDMMTAPAEEKAEETFDNEPEEKISDIDTLVNVHSGGLNRKKQAFAKAQDGDNAMAVEDTITAEDLTNSLRAQYESFKEAYQKEAKIAEAKPDFLDMDKDGDKKEPMKKAIKDKEAKTEAKDEKCEKCGKMHLTASSCGGSH
jgi:hypothetical protein